MILSDLIYLMVRITYQKQFIQPTFQFHEVWKVIVFGKRMIFRVQFQLRLREHRWFATLRHHFRPTRKVM